MTDAARHDVWAIGEGDMSAMSDAGAGRGPKFINGSRCPAN